MDRAVSSTLWLSGQSENFGLLAVPERHDKFPSNTLRANGCSVMITASFSGLVFCAICASESGSVKVGRDTVWPGKLRAHIYEMHDECGKISWPSYTW